jgi:hypothetical protein
MEVTTMSRPKPPSLDCIQDIRNRIDKLLEMGTIKKDLPISTAEAQAITGLSMETLRRYASLGHISAFKFPGRNLYPLHELCDWVERHYRGAVIAKTSDLNGYVPGGGGAKRGRPKRQKKE